MNKVVAVVCIIIIQFLIGFFMSFVMADESITQISGTQAINYSNVATPNISATPANAAQSASSIYNVLSAMFLFSVPNLPDFPQAIAVIVSFVNWLMLLIEMILVILIIFQDIIGNVNIKLF